MIGQHIGEKKPRAAGDAVGTTIILFAALGIILTILLEIFAGNIVSLLKVPSESVDKTILYIRICSAGIVVITAYNVISGVLRGVGNAKLPFIFVGIACVVNIIGDLLCVGILHMDVAGPCYDHGTACIGSFVAVRAAQTESAGFILQRTMQDLFPGAEIYLECRRTYRIAGSDSTDLIPGDQFYH